MFIINKYLLFMFTYLHLCSFYCGFTVLEKIPYVEQKLLAASILTPASAVLQSVAKSGCCLPHCYSYPV